MNTRATIDALGIATSYIKRGWNPVPVPYMTKKPIGDGWQKRVINDSNVQQFFNGEQQNVGVILGPTSGGLTDVDLDCPEAIAVASFILPPTGAIFGRPSARFAHWLYRTELAQHGGDETQTDDKAVQKFVDLRRLHTEKDKKATVVELRIGGHKGAQTVFPGSTHESGEPISWEEADEPAVVDGAELLKKVKLVAVGALFVRYWPGLGAKHDAALAVGGFMARAGHKPEWIKYFVESIARAAGCSDVADKKNAAFDSATNTIAGKKTWGLPAIKNLFGDHVASRAVEWLDYEGGAQEGETKEFVWSEPVELPTGLKPVAVFDYGFLPATLAPWVKDISERMQCPPDFVAVSALTALGSALGRKVGIRPQQNTNWLEVPNLWGCVVGRPGTMKSPAVAEAQKPLQWLEGKARKANEKAAEEFALAQEVYELRKEHAKKKAKAELDDEKNILETLRIEAPEKPKPRRLIVNDCTYEALGEILADNPNGVLASRDELVSLLKTLDREEYVAARGFFLTAWSGKEGYTFDRIMRGRTHINAACISLIGSTQPGRLGEYIHRAMTGGSGDDGLIQRFGLLVWPDQSSEWKEVDREPDEAAREKAWKVFEELANLENTYSAVDAESEFDLIPFLRFDEAAQAHFSKWRESLERRLRSGGLHPAMESHLSKYRKLVPALALINHLADGGKGAVNEKATLRAISFSEYLESHARRAYAAGSENETNAAKAILGHIRKGDLTDGFTARDIHQRDWSSLTDHDQVKAGLDLLVEYDWIAAGSVSTGGRPKTVYRINPRGSK